MQRKEAETGKKRKTAQEQGGKRAVEAGRNAGLGVPKAESDSPPPALLLPVLATHTARAWIPEPALPFPVHLSHPRFTTQEHLGHAGMGPIHGAWSARALRDLAWRGH